MDFVNLFISFNGRISRAKFWIVVLCCAVFSLAVIGVTMAVSSSMDTMFRVGLVACIPIIYFAVVNGIKRLHDRNKSGWWICLFGAPLVLSSIAGALGIGTGSDSGASVVIGTLQFILLIISIWAFVELGCLRGSIGQNKYGSDPLAPEVLTPPVRTHA